jgi:hypothetical protein
MIVKLTSGGIDMGVRPIFDWLKAVAENARTGALWKAGTKKEGIDIEDEEVITFSSPRNLVVDSIVASGA